MKKFISIILVLTFVFAMTVPSYAAAYNAKIGDYNYYYADGSSGRTLCLQGYHGNKTNLTASDIPTTVSTSDFSFNTAYETPVSEGVYAMESLESFYYTAGTTAAGRTPVLLDSIEIPYGFTSLGSNCFRGQSKLTQLFIPDSVTVINSNAIESCGSISLLVLPANLQSMANTLLIAKNADVYFRGMTAPALNTSFVSNVSSPINVYYPEGATGYDETSFTQGFNKVSVTYHTYTELPAAAKSYYDTIGSGNTPAPATVIDEINAGEDVTFDEDFDADGASATMTSGQTVDIGTYALKNATINTNGGTLTVNGISISGNAVEFDENGKISVANDTSASLREGSSQAILESFIHDGSATIDYNIAKSDDNTSKDVSVEADGFASGSRIVFGLTVNNIPTGINLTFTKK